jgi:RNA ligase (TIGR02306 family)
MIETQEKTEFQVRIVRIGDVQKHPGADTLSLVDVEGYPVVIKTGAFQRGDLAVYVPVDAIVPTSRPEFAFLAEGKATKTEHRIKAARLRGIFSMGLLVPVPPEIAETVKAKALSFTARWEEGQPTIWTTGSPFTEDPGIDVAAVMGITKYIPESERRALMRANNPQAKKEAKRVKNQPQLPVYGLDPFRKYKGALKTDEEVVITEKIHGCNARFAFVKGRLWVGSHKAMRGATRHRAMEFVERLKLKLMSLLNLRHRAHTLAEHGDIWWQVAENYGLKEKLKEKPNFILYGEIYGDGLQDLSYDAPDQVRFRAFDVYDMEKKRFLDWKDFMSFIIEIGLDPINDVVPVEYVGPWDDLAQNVFPEQANKGKSSLADHLVEGFVIKPTTERFDPRVGRVALKLVGEGYLLRKKG